MIKIISLLYKKSGLSHEEFRRYWKNTHAPLAVRVIPGLRKYTQNHLMGSRGVKHKPDGFAELWFEDLGASKRFLAWRKSSEAKELLDDEDKFLDRSRTVRCTVEEYVVM